LIFFFLFFFLVYNFLLVTLNGFKFGNIFMLDSLQVSKNIALGPLQLGVSKNDICDSGDTPCHNAK
jgi:hypothetical protein